MVMQFVKRMFCNVWLFSQIRGQIANMYDSGYHTTTKSFHLFFWETVCSRFSAVVKSVVSRKETNAFYLSDLPTFLLVGQPTSGPTKTLT